MSNDKHKDKLFSQQQDMIVDFVFDEKVVGVFPDMIRRSVPGYDTVIPLLGVFAEKYVQPNSVVYDLGCSLGAATLAIRRRIAVDGCTIYAIDNSESMLEQCTQNIKLDDCPTPVEMVCEDILDTKIERASLVVINFTLQFIAPEKRLALLKKIYAGLLPGGAVVIVDKIYFSDAAHELFTKELHTQFKRANGYSDMEISQKRSALENVLIPDTAAQHLQRLQSAGFNQTYTWFQCFNFAGFCAIKA